MDLTGKGEGDEEGSLYGPKPQCGRERVSWESAEETIPNFFLHQELASVTYKPLILVPVFKKKIIMLKMYLCMKLMNKPTIHIFRTVYWK